MVEDDRLRSDFVFVILAGLLFGLLAGCGGSVLVKQPAKPHLLIFHAEWCHWCPSRADIARLQRDYPGVDICDVDIDEHPEAKQQYGFTKIPFFLLCSEQGCWPSNSLNEVKGWLGEL